MISLKHLLESFLFPVQFIFIIFAIGIYFVWFSRKPDIGKLILASVLLIYFAFTTNPLAITLLGSLENQFRPLDDATLSSLTRLKIKWIVVLGGGVKSNDKLPITSRLTESGLARIVEGIRLYRQLPGSKIILSGGNQSSSLTEADVMAHMAAALGVPKHSLVLEKSSINTADQAHLIPKLVRNAPFILVTSASHMPRAVMLFKANGMTPIPAPVDFHAKSEFVSHFAAFIPNVGNLIMIQKAIYEHLAIIYVRFSPIL